MESRRAWSRGRCRPLVRERFELKDGDERAWYRLVYLSVLDGVIYVFNCFEKSSWKTDRRDLQTAKSRMAIARKIAQERREKR